MSLSPAQLPETPESQTVSDDERNLGGWGVSFAVEESEEEPNSEKPDFSKEFEAVWPEWIRCENSIDWRKEFPDELKDVSRLRVIEHLLPLNTGKLYKRIEGEKKYGYLPVMARSSRWNIGALAAQSFCERVISAANIVMTDGNTLLSDEELYLLVALRMNREFMKWARERFAHLAKSEFRATVIPEKENEGGEIFLEEYE